MGETNKIDNGGPAFAQALATVDGNGNPLSLGDVERNPIGMTLRDWFAGQADIPWNAVIETLAIKGNQSPTVIDLLTYRAELKYIEADAMIAARKGGAA